MHNAATIWSSVYIVLSIAAAVEVTHTVTAQTHGFVAPVIIHCFLLPSCPFLIGPPPSSIPSEGDSP